MAKHQKWKQTDKSIGHQSKLSIIRKQYYVHKASVEIGKHQKSTRFIDRAWIEMAKHQISTIYIDRASVENGQH